MTENSLFDTSALPGVFAEVVFDRPIDQAYTYAVPEALRDRITVGQRVECSFGRGDKGSIGYVIGIGDIAPQRAVKSILRFADDVPLVDDQLLKLTRWMADYYLCGWGQVLHAVVPAGARDKAGTKNATFVVSLLPEELPHPLPTVTPKQKQALDRLKQEGRQGLFVLRRMVDHGIPRPDARGDFALRDQDAGAAGHAQSDQAVGDRDDDDRAEQRFHHRPPVHLPGLPRPRQPP